MRSREIEPQALLAETELPRHPSCSAVARRWAEDELPDLEPRALADVKLILTELVNNAYIHGKGRITAQLGRDRRRVRAEVVDEGTDARVRITRKPIGEGGQGLRIVDHLSSAWGAHKGTTHVWADLSL